jgi:GNAT superfamily N-acetyltransferase
MVGAGDQKRVFGEIKPDWRMASFSDLENIHDISCQIHPNLPESQETIINKLEFFPQGCWLLSSGNESFGYALSHPWQLFNIPELNKALSAPLQIADCLYIHDLALLEVARGKGAARQLVERLTQIAYSHNLTFLALTSVYDTQSIWQRLGFKLMNHDVLSVKLDSYGPSAKYMVKSLVNS